ncbi:MAG: glycosyltransferase family 10 [Gallionellaceae bacterium]
MNRVIAFCTNASVFQNNQILDENIAKEYPGALWVTMLYRAARECGIEVLTGDVAISNVASNKFLASNVLVIQEEDSPHGLELIRIGAVPFVVLSGESPLYASKFYANLPRISAIFNNRILFRGAFGLTSSAGMNHVFHFPSFCSQIESSVLAWSERKFLVMVAANKYWKVNRPIHRQLLAWIRDTIVRRKSNPLMTSGVRQLHDRRLEILEYFGSEGRLDLFGRNWDSLNNLPTSWQLRLKKIIGDMRPSSCSDKQAVISKYKFAICFENMVYPGYVTEKIIDCFRVGVIPLYIGAPDISDFVPPNTYLDLRKFSSLDKLDDYLRAMTEEDAMRMIDAAQSFLLSEQGLEFSYEGFAKNVLQLALKVE